MGHDLLFCPDRVTPSATAGRGGVDLTEGYYLLREGDPRETFCEEWPKTVQWKKEPYKLQTLYGRLCFFFVRD